MSLSAYFHYILVHISLIESKDIELRLNRYELVLCLPETSGQGFELWLSAVEASHIPELRRLAQSLLKDKSAVVAGLTLSYSNRSTVSNW